jgi:nucleotide-binding universal stress UspA family protein
LLDEKGIADLPRRDRTGAGITRQFLSNNGIPVETHLLVRGFTPGEDFVEFAKEHDIDEIVVGIRKTSPVGKIVFGSNARYVILNAHCPVVTVK